MKFKKIEEVSLAVRLFHIQQLFLAPDATTVTRKIAVTTNYAVAGNYDGYFVHSVGLSNCSFGIGLTDIIGLLFIASCLTIWDLQQGKQDLLLELRAWCA